MNLTTQLVSSHLDSPVGELTLVASDVGLRAVLWPHERVGRVRLDDVEPGDHPILTDTAAQLVGYFDGSRTEFDLPLDLVGTDFQVQVWRLLTTIGFGQTSTYAAQADQLGRPTASRAVGGAIGRNPISIVVPCHRVVGASGALTGFAGGVDAKRWLLDHELGSLLS